VTYDGQALDGTVVRVHIDNLDAEFAYLMTRPPGDHGTWSKPMELRLTPDGPLPADEA
jgi:hypothetical protein